MTFPQSQMRPADRGIVQAVLDEVFEERLRQFNKWGHQNPPNGTGSVFSKNQADAAKKRTDEAFANGTGTWGQILGEEFWEVMAEKSDEQVRAELVQVSAVAIAWIEAIDRRTSANQ